MDRLFDVNRLSNESIELPEDSHLAVQFDDSGDSREIVLRESNAFGETMLMMTPERAERIAHDLLRAVSAVRYASSESGNGDENSVLKLVASR